MDEKTTKLLEQLANKLGTTTEYLWGVLIKQAPIEAFTVLGKWILVITFGTILYKLHIKFLGEFKKRGHSWYDEYDESIQAPMIVGLFALVLFVAAGFMDSGVLVYGFMNPEYYALQEVSSLLND